MLDFQSREKKLGLVTETLAWFTSVAFFRRTESETHYLVEPKELDSRYHKSILASLVAQGERLLTRIQQSGGLPENIEGVKVGDVDAAVEELRNTQAQWSGDMTPQRREQILQEISHVTPSLIWRKSSKLGTIGKVFTPRVGAFQI